MSSEIWHQKIKALSKIVAHNILLFFFITFRENKMAFDVNCLPSRWFPWNAKPYFFLKKKIEKWKKKKKIKMLRVIYNVTILHKIVK